MSHVCFVTEELYPVTSGGAGALIYNSIRVLKQRGHQVSILLDVSREVFERAAGIFTAQAAEAPVDRLYSVSELAHDLPPYGDQAFGEWYYWRSHRLFWALRKVVQQAPVDFVEFSDFYGPAYF